MSNKWLWRLILIIAAIGFVVPLLSTFLFATAAHHDYHSIDIFIRVTQDPYFLSSAMYSSITAIVAVVLAIVTALPMAYVIRVYDPGIRTFVEITVSMPLLVPPIAIAFGYIKSFGSEALIPLLNMPMGGDILLVCGYATLALPFVYRAIDAGLRDIDVRSLREASMMLGAGPILTICQIVLPNIKSVAISGALLAYAAVFSEFVITSLLGRPGLGPHLQRVGNLSPYDGAALTLICFAITWVCLWLVQRAASSRRKDGGR